MEDLIRNLFSSFDPQIKVQPYQGKTFIYHDSLRNVLLKTEGVALITDVIEDNAVMMYGKESDVVKLKGVSSNFTQQNRLDTFIAEGKLKLKVDSQSFALIGRGLQYKLSINIKNQFIPITFYYPNKAKIKNITSLDAFNRSSLLASGVFAIEKQYDDHYVIVPLEVCQQLMNYDHERSYLEIKVEEGYDIQDVQKAIRARLSHSYQVLNTDEQHESLLRAIRIEKLIVNIMLILILAISSVGIFFCLSMLVIQKRKHMAVLMSLGASRATVKNLFLIEGALISLTGAVIGIVLGLTICWLQIRYGLVSIGTETSVVDAYPVRISFNDVWITFIAVIGITFIASIRPALKASSISLKEHLQQ